MTMEPKRSKRKLPKKENPIHAATRAWLISLPHSLQPWTGETGLEDFLAQQVPKRFTIYEPMALLPSGSFASVAWRTLLASSDIGDEKFSQLWELILQNLSKPSVRLTRLAVNEGIPLQSNEHAQQGVVDVVENILRSPSGLRLLYGDFGPADMPAEPSAADFEKGFWVSAKQNGIFQTWAPRWTMFSRGNVKEKARLLDFHDAGLAQGELSHRYRPSHRLRDAWAVDLYAGIGYFTFSYAKLGMKVLCWEINPWSVEGLRRGARANGWDVRVIQGEDLQLPPAHFMTGDEKIFVFLEDNKLASRRIAEFNAYAADLDILHVNCGFLPTSQPVWQDSWDLVRTSEDAWLHLHENVGVADIDRRRTDIQMLFDGLATTDSRETTVMVEHVELVKTYAPDVWHCVFDVYITRS